jgi:SAM-dependent methyltransferase
MPTREVFPQRLDPDALSGFTYASRKEPDAMNLRMVECGGCGVLFATPAPTPSDLARLYRAASFDTSEAGAAAARTYASILGEFVAQLPSRDGAVDIGTGTGALLEELLARGWTRVRGVEPSAAPVAASRPGVRELIVEDVFHPQMFGAERFALATCFQTLEHVPDPLGLAQSVRAMLQPGGAFMVVVHDRQFWLNRLLGRRSPIVDVEHLQLFCPTSLRRLFEAAGYEGVTVRPVVNAYPLSYWVRLLPLPRVIRAAVVRLLGRLGEVEVRVGVGNLVGVGFSQ